jgi:hypothetical protein
MGKLNNPDFNVIEFEYIKNQAGLNSFVLTSKNWIEATNAIGLISKAKIAISQMKILVDDGDEYLAIESKKDK